MLNIPAGQPESKVYVIVPFFNGEVTWIERCLDSIRNQKSHYGFEVYVVDDASTNDSGRRAREICSEAGFFYSRNANNHKNPRNIWETIQTLDAKPWDVILLVDGDDYLPHEGVIQRFEELFAEEQTWLTYGQFMSDPPNHGCAPAIPPPCDIGRDFRVQTSINQFFNHPLVFRKFLFDAIPKSQFMVDCHKQWFTASYDRVLMIPMLELATPYDGEPHWKFLNEVLYVYNSENDASEWRVPELSVPHQRVNYLYSRGILPPLGSDTFSQMVELSNET